MNSPTPRSPSRSAPAPAPRDERPGRPPEPRVEQLIAEATSLFQDAGYRNVSVEEIGAAVGLTGPAVYRYFPSKQDILAKALATQVEGVRALLTQAEERSESPAEQLGVFFDLLATRAAHGDVSTLWTRERRHLDRSDLDDMDGHHRTLIDALASKFDATEAGIDAQTAKLLATAAVSVFSSTAAMRGSLTPRRLTQIQRAVVDSILSCPLPRGAQSRARFADGSSRRPAARRDRILAAATRMFFARGFPNVRIHEIAAEADVSPATVYQEYAGKTDILMTIMRRGLENLHWISVDALAESSAVEALDVLVGVFLDYSLGPNGRVLAIAHQDIVYLPEADQVSLRRTASDYTAEWTAAILARSPTLTHADANALTQALTGFVYQVISSPELRSRPGIEGEFRALASAILSPVELCGGPGTQGLSPRRLADIPRSQVVRASRPYSK